MARQGEPRILFPRESESSSSRESSPDYRESSPDILEASRLRCSCKSTCQTCKCPCKKANKFCTARCKCASKRNPCKNQPPSADQLMPSSQSSDNRLQTLQAFITTLSPDQCHKPIVEAYNRAGGIEMAKAVIEMPPGDHQPQPPSDGAPSWCICGRCRLMPTAPENKCCRQRPCITQHPSFHSLVLDREVLIVSIIGRREVFVDRSDYSNEGMRHAAYTQYVLWQNGYLGRGNRKVVPSCATWAIRDKYPNADGIYTGFVGL